MSRPSRGATTAIVGLFMASATASGVGAAQPASGGRSVLPGGAADITETTEGRKLTAEAAGRYARKGVGGRPLRAIKDGSGILIAPTGTRFATVPVTLADGRKGTALAPVTPGAPATLAAAPAGAVVATLAPTWRFQNNQCFTRISDVWSWMDHCYWMYRLANDGNGSYDWFAIAHTASMGPNSPWALTAAKIRAYRHSASSPQTWADWSPKSDWNGGSCGTLTVGITLPVAGIGITTERCPQVWDYWKSANGTSPDYSLTWLGPGTRQDREMTFEISVRVAQGGWAQWVLPAEVHGGPL